MWEIVSILKEHGVSVRFFRSEFPGEIVYSDDYQVVAETAPQAWRLVGRRLAPVEGDG